MKRLLTLNALLAIGLGSIFLLPASSKIQDSAIVMDLPPLIGDWTAGAKEEASPEVKKILQASAYENRTYAHDLNGQIVRVSMVLSSDNINQSIHRPERCLPAQGHRILGSSETQIPFDDGGGMLTVTRLLTEKRYEDQEGDVQTIQSLTYYWFVGKNTLTNSHYDRALVDMKDRLFGGFSQKWAYITFDSFLNPEGTNAASQDEGIVDLIREIIPEILPSFSASF
ncbi:MAG: exosortase C-terminal domain/associated protein EpsI [Verrucomicrobiales bacterium]|jgi:EpsI family protein